MIGTSQRKCSETNDDDEKKVIVSSISASRILYYYTAKAKHGFEIERTKTENISIYIRIELQIPDANPFQIANILILQ